MNPNRILKPGRNCLDIYDAEASGLLVDARDFYGAFVRGALGARQYILMAGWQFESRVRLLRGADEEAFGGDSRFLPFLTSLCEKNPDLHIYILAWDFTFLFSLNRQWFQKWIFETWGGHERIHFVDDDCHALGASHHQKFVVIDGTLAFAGGMDLCAGRWDDRRHQKENPERVDPSGQAFDPVHDVQAHVTGPAAGALADLFTGRWLAAGGPPLTLPPPSGRPPAFDDALPIAIPRVALSRTRARTLLPPQDEIREIRQLYQDAIAAAEKLIYLENQYFTSGAVHRALLERLADENRPKLQVLHVLPQRAHTLMEQASLAHLQKKILDSLRTAAKQGGHRLGIYSPVSGAGPSEVQVYIHSKVLVVDDRFLTVGSANTTNRSMGLDTELNLSWEAAPNDGESIRSIREARLSLLAEHLGNGDMPDSGDLVEFLDRRADAGDTRLRRHDGDVEDVARWLDELGATEIADSEKPFLDEQIYETVSRDPAGFFARGLTALNGILGNGPAGSSTGRMARFRRFLRYVFPIAALAAGLTLFWLYFRGP